MLDESQASHVFGKCSATDPHPEKLSYSGHFGLQPKQRRLCLEAATSYIGLFSSAVLSTKDRRRGKVYSRNIPIGICFPIPKCER